MEKNCPLPSAKEISKKRRQGGEMAVAQYIDEWRKEWAEKYKYLSTRVTEYYDVTPKTKDEWEDNRIMTRLDCIMDRLKRQEYIIRVETNGIVTYANLDAAFIIQETPTNQ